MTAGQQQAERKAREARDHPVLHRWARVGMAAYGVVYVIIGWLAGQLALGDREGSASGEGALRELAQQPLGRWTLWLVAAGLAGLAVRQAFQAAGGHDDEDGARRWAARAGSAVRGGVYVVLTVLAVRTALGDGGGGGGGGGGTGGLTATVLGWPLGPVLVILVGLVVVGVGGASAWKGIGDRWRKDLEVDGTTGTVGTVVTVLARTGYVARGVSFAAIGALFVWAGLTHDPDRSGGLDQAIVRFRGEPYGPWVLVLVAVGLACYGAYHVARGWYLRER